MYAGGGLDGAGEGGDTETREGGERTGTTSVIKFVAAGGTIDATA